MKDSTEPSGPIRSPSSFIYAVIGLLVAVLLICAGGFLWVRSGPDIMTIGGPFKLESSDGKTVTDQDFRGKYMLVYFGYTYCPDVCPTTLNAVAAALDALGSKSKELSPIFITVDPQRDTPEVMKRYTSAFSPALVGLTGTSEEIAQVAKEYRVYYAKHVTGPNPNDYSMDHSSIIYLMSPNGKFITPINAEGSPEDIAKEIGKVIS